MMGWGANEDNALREGDDDAFTVDMSVEVMCGQLYQQISAAHTGRLIFDPLRAFN